MWYVTQVLVLCLIFMHPWAVRMASIMHFISARKNASVSDILLLFWCKLRQSTRVCGISATYMVWIWYMFIYFKNTFLFTSWCCSYQLIILLLFFRFSHFWNHMLILILYKMWVINCTPCNVWCAQGVCYFWSLLHSCYGYVNISGLFPLHNNLLLIYGVHF